MPSKLFQSTIHQRASLLMLAVALVAWTPSSSKGQAAEADGWTDLLEARDLSEHWTTEGNWSINEQGVVTLEPRPGEEGWSRFDAYLWSNKKYEDFEIQFDYKVEQRGNSGFFFRVSDKSSPVEHGIEVQIYDSYGKPADRKLTDHDSGGIIPGIPPTKNATKPAGQWNRFHITSRNDRLTVKLNGEVVNEVDLSRPELAGRASRGFIGFQDHSLPLSLRNIRVREL